MVLICIFMMISDIKDLFVYPAAIACILLGKKNLRPMLILKCIFCLFALLFSCMSSLYILDINSYQIYELQIFSLIL